MNPDIKCLCSFGNPSIGIAENCPIHGKARQLQPVTKAIPVLPSVEAKDIAVSFMQWSDSQEAKQWMLKDVTHGPDDNELFDYWYNNIHK